MLALVVVEATNVGPATSATLLDDTSEMMTIKEVLVRSMETMFSHILVVQEKTKIFLKNGFFFLQQNRSQ